MLSFAFVLVWCLIICAMRKRIYLAIGVVKEACIAIMAMPVLVLYPISPLIGFLVFVIPWAVFMVYLASSGDLVAECFCLGSQSYNTNTTTEIGGILSKIDDREFFEDKCGDGCYLHRSFNYATNTKYAGLFLLFSFFWTTQFIIAW